MYVVIVNYQNQNDKRGWTYKVTADIKLKVGDKVVVPVVDHFTFKVATVISRVTEPDSVASITNSTKTNYRWVVQKLELDRYTNRLVIETPHSAGARL